MSDHFPIVIDVEEKAVGSVLRLLNTTPGILTIHLQLANASAQAAKQLQGTTLPAVVKPTRKERYAERKAYQPKDGSDSLRLVLAKALSKSPLHLNVLREILARTGYSGMSLHSCITKMLSQKLIQRTAPGTYRLTVKGERKYLGSVTKVDAIGRHQSRVTDNRNGVRGFVLRLLDKVSMQNDDLRQALMDGGYSPANMYNSVKLLREEGLIERQEDVYMITSNGRKEIAEPVHEATIVENEQHIGETA